VKYIFTYIAVLVGCTTVQLPFRIFDGAIYWDGRSYVFSFMGRKSVYIKSIFICIIYADKLEVDYDSHY
jgi:hypothetical protein